MKRIFVFVTTILSFTLVYSALAQDWYAPGNYYEPSWTFHDGIKMTNIGGGLYLLVTTVANPGHYQWKVSQLNWQSPHPPGMQNSYFTTSISGQTVWMYFDTNYYADGFQPAQYLVYTDITSFGSHLYVAVGDWQDVDLNSPGGDWDPSTTRQLMRDDGLNGDLTAGDNIYTYVAIITTAGTYLYHVALDGGWLMQIGADGKSQDGTNLPFTVLVAGDTVRFECEVIKGRIKVTTGIPGTPGPPWYHIGDVQGITLDTTRIMYDDGTHGDEIAGDGIYTAEIVVPTHVADSSHWFAIVDGAGNRYPPSSNMMGCYYYTSYDNQTIKIFFDTNVIDSRLLWVPRTKYAYTEPAAIGTHQYVAVGDFQSEFGGSDWNPADPATLMRDDGTNGDQVAGDNIYTFQGTFPVGGTFQYKVALDGSWLLQIGDDGRSKQGNPGAIYFTVNEGETWRFEADVVKGLIRCYNINTPPRETMVESGLWMLYE